MRMNNLKDAASTLLLRANVALGTALLSLDAMAVDPIGASSYSGNVGTSVKSLNTNIGQVPELLLNVSQIGGVFAMIKAYSTWKAAQEGNDPKATPLKAGGFGVGGVIAYFLPSMLGMGANTILPGI